MNFFEDIVEDVSVDSGFVKIPIKAVPESRLIYDICKRLFSMLHNLTYGI